MYIVCICDDVENTTRGKKYPILKEDPYIFNDTRYLIVNDINEEKWYKQNPNGIIRFLPVTDYWVEYLGNNSKLTKGKWYQILDRNNRFSFRDEHYYFLDDKDEVVGMFSYGNFRNVTNEKKREDKLKTILNDKSN
jgi:hypothetical protein